VWRRPSAILEYNFCSYRCLHQWQKDHYERDEKVIAKIKESLRNKWLDNDFALKVVRSWHIKPTIPEKQLSTLFEELSLPYRYVGDGQFILGGKCPDFLNTNGQKKLIELFGNFWHEAGSEQKRVNYFREYGFSTLIIWENELKIREALEAKLLSFDRGT